MRFLDRAAALGLVGLLTWLLMLSLAPHKGPGREALMALEAYGAGESALHRDTMSARSGFMNNYDPLDADIDGMRKALGKAGPAKKLAGGPALIASLARHFQEQERATERFKTRNALLQNSLAYFGLFNERIGAREHRARIRHAVDRLSNAMLQLSLDPSRVAGDMVQQRIDDLGRLCRAEACGGEAVGIQAHAQLLARLLPETEGLIRRQVRSSAGRITAALREKLLERERHAETLAVRYRFLLYVVSLGLVALLVRWGLKMRVSAAALRRQLALEHALSQMSMRLITAPTGSVRAVIERSLGQLAVPLGADRAFFLLTDHGEIWSWPQSDARLPSCWTIGARELLRSDAGILLFSRNDLPPDAPLREALQREGLASCLCILPSPGAETTNMLAFGFRHGCEPWPEEQQAILRAALDAASLAFEHDALAGERSRLEAELAHARRVETVGAFASGIAHNFNNLLGAISGNVEIAAARSLDAVTRKHLERIQISAGRGEQLVRGLLNYVRRRDHQRRVVAIDDLVAETCQLAEAALGSAARIELALGAPGASVLVDPAQMQQVLLNLCQNAAQAMDDGTVRVATSVRSIGEPLEVGETRLQRGDFAVLEVADTGTGIGPEALKRVFEPFFTTKSAGTGLGLSTAREIVSDAGGELTLESALGVGTRAIVWLPLRPAGSPAAPERDIRGSGEAVLYLASDERERLAGEDLLAALGYEPLGFSDPAAAHQAFAEAPDRFDAVLIDDRILDRAAIGAVRAMRALRPHTPRLLAVASARGHKPELLAEAGITTIVNLPLNPFELATALRRTVKAETVR